MIINFASPEYIAQLEVDFPPSEVQAIAKIIEERDRVITQLGYTPEHDDKHTMPEIVLFAAMKLLKFNPDIIVGLNDDDITRLLTQSAGILQAALAKHLRAIGE